MTLADMLNLFSGADPGISGGGDGMNEEKICRGLKVTLFHELYSDFALSK
jgi:hypothetical protein